MTLGKCECGGMIKIITFTENGKRYMDYGICNECLKQIVLPQEEV